MGRLGAVVLIGLACLVARPALANRCGDQNPARCGLDTQTNPPDPALGDGGGCTEASMADLPLFDRTGACPPDYTKVIYDVGQPFPDNGMPGDTDVVGKTSFMIVRAGDKSPCAHMVDTEDPKVCPDPDLCPDPASPQPEGAIKVPLTGYMVGCWSPRDHDGCRDFALYTKSICIHAQHQLLGPGCGFADDIDCSQFSVEQVAIDVPGAKNRRTCAPSDSTNSCRGTRRNGDPGFRFWIGGFCATNNCADPGVAPTVDGNTCKVAWGATKLGYDIPPGKNINSPGWYDWKTGAFKIDLSSPKPTCGPLAAAWASAPASSGISASSPCRAPGSRSPASAIRRATRRVARRDRVATRRVTPPARAGRPASRGRRAGSDRAGAPSRARSPRRSGRRSR